MSPPPSQTCPGGSGAGAPLRTSGEGGGGRERGEGGGERGGRREGRGERREGGGKGRVNCCCKV